jgi:hypothetical protein
MLFLELGEKTLSPLRFWQPLSVMSWFFISKKKWFRTARVERAHAWNAR